LNSTKAQGPDGVPAWLLKENAYCLAEPITDILTVPSGKAVCHHHEKELTMFPSQKKNQLKNLTKPPTNLSHSNTVKSCIERHCRGVHPTGHF
jgi:hypothetical protein